ncbi:MarR family transcriptional regulator [Microbacterium sp. 5K110]|uniref:MarR family winged helix-turn-helix transcriptional regulator n=1 Tax=unclassified Microbacterium TaxID=2609290 RepID=UPI0010FD97DD|nr:MarR family transcriptional regulator [Microbacterium sp. 5K110]TLF27692.1 MarR family transcriptional regulator [Microbacterium sp. 5K110]
MPRRPHSAVPLESTPAVMAPVVGGGGLDARAAMQAIITWASSGSRREDLLRRSAFPLPDDMLAFLVMNQLAYRGAARPTELADAAHTGRSNLSKVVRRLEAADLVGRMANPDDGRETMIALTPGGREVAERIVAASETDFAHAIAGWGDDEREQFEDLLVRLVRDLDRRVDGEVQRVSGAPWEPSTTHWDPRPHGD